MGLVFLIFYCRNNQDDFARGEKKVICGEGNDKTNGVLGVICVKYKDIHQDNADKQKHTQNGDAQERVEKFAGFFLKRFQQSMEVKSR